MGKIEKTKTILTPVEREIAVIEAPSYTAEYEKRWGYLMETVNKITPSDIAKAREKLRGEMEREEDMEKLQELRDLEMVIDAVLSLRTLENKQGVAERLAKTKIFELTRADKLASNICEGNLRDAIFNLNEATYALARAKFPEDVKRQVQDQEESDKKKVAKSRKKIIDMNVK